MNARIFGAFKLIVLALFLSFAAGCKSEVPVKRVGLPNNNILLIINTASKDSIAVGEYYSAKRNIPERNIIRLKCSVGERFANQETFYNELANKVSEYLSKPENRERIDYIVLTKGIPFIVDGMVPSVDGKIGVILAEDKFPQQSPNPFYGSKDRFSSKKFGFYLVSRLDANTTAEAKRLVDLSLQAKPKEGIFLFDQDPTRNVSGYEEFNNLMAEACNKLRSKGLICRLDTGAEFVGWKTGLMGYVSWGSNDKFYSRHKYKSNRFHPGAIAETAVSTSARTLKPTKEGQSLITDLIEIGVTAVKGYIGEPGLSAVASPSILFDRYTDGWSMIESYYAASRFICWREVVIGDPLCSPYKGWKPKKSEETP